MRDSYPSSENNIVKTQEPVVGMRVSSPAHDDNHALIDIYNSRGEFLQIKQVYIPQDNYRSINEWLVKYKQSISSTIGVLRADSGDFKHSKYVAMINQKAESHGIFVSLIIRIIY